MKGSVLNFSIQNNAGVISADDGNRYSFSGNDWRVEGPPISGTRVDFDVDNGAATGIYADASAPTVSRSAAATAPAGSVSATATSAPTHRYCTLGIVGMYAGVLAIFFYQTALLGFPLMLVGLGLSVVGLVIGTQRGERVGFAIVGIVLCVTPFFLKVLSTVVSGLVVGGSLDGTLPSLMSSVLPFI